jgi:hypothetical protein
VWQVLDRRITYEHIPYDQSRSSMMSAGYWEWVVDGLQELYRLIDASSPSTLTRQNYFPVSWSTLGDTTSQSGSRGGSNESLAVRVCSPNDW